MGELGGFNCRWVENREYVEVWQYREPVTFNVASERNEESIPTLQFESLEELREYIEKNENKKESAREKYSAIERQQRHAREQRFNICRLIDLNWKPETKFLTLTFAENVTEPERAHGEFKKFLKRLNRKIFHTSQSKLQYLAVVERHKKEREEGEGLAIHFHVVLFNLPFVDVKELQGIWGNGFLWINKVEVDAKTNIGLYLSKYFEKEYADDRDFKQKKMFKSQNLEIPQIKRTNLAVFPEFDSSEILYESEYERCVPDYSRPKGKLVEAGTERERRERLTPQDIANGMPWRHSKVKYFKIKKKAGVNYDFSRPQQ